MRPAPRLFDPSQKLRSLFAQCHLKEGNGSFLALNSSPFCSFWFIITIVLGYGTSFSSDLWSFPFGYGKEQFFWSFLVATMLFGISGILSLEQGINSILAGLHHIQNANVSYVILGISAIFEGNG